jgi:hypothetical protein
LELAGLSSPEASIPSDSSSSPFSLATRCATKLRKPVRAPNSYSTGLGAEPVPPSASGSSISKLYHRTFTSTFVGFFDSACTFDFILSRTDLFYLVFVLFRCFPGLHPCL